MAVFVMMIFIKYCSVHAKEQFYASRRFSDLISDILYAQTWPHQFIFCRNMTYHPHYDWVQLSWYINRRSIALHMINILMIYYRMKSLCYKSDNRYRGKKDKKHWRRFLTTTNLYIKKYLYTEHKVFTITCISATFNTTLPVWNPHQ
jgi:hypothetical protein